MFNANNGAGIPNVSIRYQNACTGLVGETRSNGSGFYSFNTSNGCSFSLTHFVGGKPCCDGWGYFNRFYDWNGYYITANIPLQHT